MRAEPTSTTGDSDTTNPASPRWCLLAVVIAAVVGVVLLLNSARSISATYDEPTYLNVAARWWRTGDQTQITRMGSPLTFWKVQQIPVLWLLDHSSRRALVDNPVAHQPELLILARAGVIPVWLAAFGLTAYWSRRLYGPRAMVFAAWLFVLSPNLLAHGTLVTMELPLVACTTGVFFLFWRFLQTGQSRYFWASATLGGLAFSCKFTAVLLPPLLGLVWWLDLRRSGAIGFWRPCFRVALGMTVFVVAMLLADFVVTGFALLPISERTGGDHPSLDGRPWLAPLVTRMVETPIPQDWVGFLTQLNHQRSGGPSYLLGDRRMTGWWYYYLVALAVKVPLSFWLLFAVRAYVFRWLRGVDRDWILPTTCLAFLAVTAIGSSRNYGVRYLLPLSPLAIVWVSALAERGGRLRYVMLAGLMGQAVAVASVFPDELTYFNEIAGGRIGGRKVLADSNLDWGQGLKSLARLQARHPEYRNLTLYYFGDARPERYEVVGTCHVIDALGGNPGLPTRFEAETRYVAVSASLQWGPWGPSDYFDALKGVTPVAMTDDTTIAVYRAADVFFQSR